MTAAAMQTVIAAALMFCGGTAIGRHLDSPNVPVAGISTTILGSALLALTLWGPH